MVLVLNSSDIQRVLTMKEVIDVVEKGFVELAEGRVQMPPRQLMIEPEKKGWVAVMSSYIKKLRALSTKVVTVYPENPNVNLPTTMATILLNDPETGIPLSVMDAGYLTALRTGAVGGVAAKYLARLDACTAGIFGAGVQARAQLESLCQVRAISEAYVCDVIHNTADRFAKDMHRKLGIKVVSVDRPEMAVKGCDIIVTASTSRTPVFEGRWLEPGTHINGIGSHMASTRELDTEAVKRSKVIVDLKKAAEREYGEILIPISEGAFTLEQLYGELGDIITGRKKGRTNNKEITFFKSGGLAIQDTAAAYLAYKNACKSGIGVEIKLK